MNHGWCDFCHQPPGMRCIRACYFNAFDPWGKPKRTKWQPFYCKRVHNGRQRIR